METLVADAEADPDEDTDAHERRHIALLRLSNTSAKQISKSHSLAKRAVHCTLHTYLESSYRLQSRSAHLFFFFFFFFFFGLVSSY